MEADLFPWFLPAGLGHNFFISCPLLTFKHSQLMDLIFFCRVTAVAMRPMVDLVCQVASHKTLHRPLSRAEQKSGAHVGYCEKSFLIGLLGSKLMSSCNSICFKNFWGGQPGHVSPSQLVCVCIPQVLTLFFCML